MLVKEDFKVKKLPNKFRYENVGNSYKFFKSTLISYFLHWKNWVNALLSNSSFFE
jgi:hypothetical protein